jgi:hypothetical protein
VATARIHPGTFTGPAGTFRRRTELTKPARDLFAPARITPPGRIHELTTPGARRYEAPRPAGGEQQTDALGRQEQRARADVDSQGSYDHGAGALLRPGPLRPASTPPPAHAEVTTAQAKAGPALPGRCRWRRFSVSREEVTDGRTRDIHVNCQAGDRS